MVGACRLFSGAHTATNLPAQSFVLLLHVNLLVIDSSVPVCIAGGLFHGALIYIYIGQFSQIYTSIKLHGSLKAVRSQNRGLEGAV